MNLKLTCVALSALLLGSCAKDTLVEVPTKSESVSLLLSATSTGAVTITKTDPPSALPTGVSTGVYVAAKDVADKYVHTNKNFVSNGAGALTTPGDPLSLTVGSSYDVYAYAPFKADATTNAILVNHGDDVLWAPKVTITDVSKEKCTAALAFKHYGARVSFVAKFANDFTAGSPYFNTNSKIEVTGFFKTGTLYVSNGALITSGDNSIVEQSVGAVTDGGVVLGISNINFIPMIGAMELTVKVTHDSKTYTGKISNVFAAGTSTTYTITISGRSPDLGVAGTLTDWENKTENLEVKE